MQPNVNELYPLNDNTSLVALVQHVGDDKSIVNAARVSFGNDSDLPMNEKDEKLIRYLLKHNHGSPFEHNLITFKIVAPMFVGEQMIRHRVGVSVNKISGRYVEMPCVNYIPRQFREQAENNRQASVEAVALDQSAALKVYEEAWKNSYNAYTELLSLGVAKEQARGVLPQSLYTEFYYTMNMRSLLHFIKLRDHPGAQYETQQYAKAMLAIAEPLFPVTIREWKALQ